MEGLEIVKPYQDAFLEDLKTLIKIPSMRDMPSEGAPFGQACRQALDAMLSICRRDGFTPIDYDGYCGAFAYGEGDESIGIAAHLDIVSIGDGWTKDPLGCQIQDGYIFGRGITDDKGPLLAAYYALKILKDQGFKPRKKILFIFGCDEETNLECMDYYAKHGEIPTMGFTPDAVFPVLYGEKGILNFRVHAPNEQVILRMQAGTMANITIDKATAVVSSLNDSQRRYFEFFLKTNQLEGNLKTVEDGIEITIYGQAAHSSRCYEGNNAGLHLLNYIGSAFDDAPAQQVYALLKDWKASGIHNQLDGAYMGFLTLNTGIIRVQEGNLDAFVDIRYPNDISGQEIVKRTQNHIEKLRYNIEIFDVVAYEPTFVDPKSFLVTTLENSYRRYTHDAFTPCLTSGSITYAHLFDNMVAYGTKFPQREDPDFFVGGPHEKDEGDKIDHLLLSIAIFKDAIEHLSK